MFLGGADTTLLKVGVATAGTANELRPFARVYAENSMEGKKVSVAAHTLLSKMDRQLREYYTELNILHTHRSEGRSPTRLAGRRLVLCLELQSRTYNIHRTLPQLLLLLL